MKNVSQFKRRLEVGKVLHTTYHGWPNDLEPRGRDLGNRVVMKKQTGSFALATEKEKGKVNSWCDYPKASMCDFPDMDTINIYMEIMNGNTVTHERWLILTYKFITDET